MIRPPRFYWTLHEIAGRWDCPISEILQWAIAEQLTLSTMIPPVNCGRQTISGLIDIYPGCLSPFPVIAGSAESAMTIHRIRSLNATEWLYIDQPAEGLTIRLSEMAMTVAEARRFEQVHDIGSTNDAGDGPQGRYDWDGMYAHLIVRIHTEGIPSTQSALVGEMQEWFIRRSELGNGPDERSIRRRVGPVWRALQDAV